MGSAVEQNVINNATMTFIIALRVRAGTSDKLLCGICQRHHLVYTVLRKPTLPFVFFFLFFYLNPTSDMFSAECHMF